MFNRKKKLLLAVRVLGLMSCSTGWAPGSAGNDAQQVAKLGPHCRLGLARPAPAVNQDSDNWRSLPTQVPWKLVPNRRSDAFAFLPVFNFPRKNTMSQFAMITGHVTYTPGDGVPIEIPRGRVEVELAPDSATLSWEAAEGIAGVTAIPRIQFDDYVRDGKITLSGQ